MGLLPYCLTAVPFSRILRGCYCLDPASHKSRLEPEIESQDSLGCRMRVTESRAVFATEGTATSQSKGRCPVVAVVDIGGSGAITFLGKKTAREGRLFSALHWRSRLIMLASTQICTTVTTSRRSGNCSTYLEFRGLVNSHCLSIFEHHHSQLIAARSTFVRTLQHSIFSLLLGQRCQENSIISQYS